MCIRDSPGIVATVNNLSFTGMAGGTPTSISVSASAFQLANETQSTSGDGVSLYNAVTLSVPSSSISGLANYNEIIVSYGGNSGSLTDTVVLQDFMKPADVITDFQVGTDKIEVTGSSQSDIEWVTSSTDAGDTIVKLVGSDSELFLLDRLRSSTLSSSDINLV